MTPDEAFSSEDEDYEYDYSDDDDMEDQEEEDRMSMYNKRLAPHSSSSCTLSAGNGCSSSRYKTSNGKLMDSDFKSSSSDVRILDATEIVHSMKRRIHEVTDVLAIPPSAAGVLLREHNWLKESLYEKYYNNPEKTQERCGVRGRCQSSFSSKSKTSTKKFQCEICYDDYSEEEMLSVPCGHVFCRGCWGGFIDCSIKSGPSCVRMTCPQVGCKEAVTEDEVAITAPGLLKKYEMYQLRSFVEMNALTRWCPGPGCSKIAMAGSSGFNGVATCHECTTSFCLRCGEEPHSPASCDELRRWKEKCRNESETANWIIANTKPCPKCSSRIEKNQGCNHITCQQCKYDFCWICLQPWADHGSNTGGYYKCNKYDPSGSSDDQSNTARAKRELDRYLHYYKRFHAHSEAQKFAKKQLKDTEARMVLLQESTNNSTWADVEFLKSAVDQLVECRRVLKYTYTFAYYMTDNARSKQKERFEHHQEMLEKFTEKLSELSEKPLTEMDRTDVVNQTRVVDRFMKNILTYVEDGMDED